VTGFAARAVALAGLLGTLAGLPGAAHAQALVADTAVLHVRASQSADGRWHATPPRIVRLDRTDTAVTPWRAAPAVPWLTVTPASGAGPAGLTIAVDPSRLGGASAVGEVVISVDGAAQQRVTVHAAVVSPDQPPIGFIDAPADGELTAGPVRLFGWVLDDVGVGNIEICRVGDPGQDDERCADGQGIRVGWAELQIGDRPDVAAAFPGFDHAQPAAWTVVLEMAATPGSPTVATSYYALARDVAGQIATVGSRSYRVVSAPTRWREALTAPAVLLAAFVVFLLCHLLLGRWLPGRDASAAPMVPGVRASPGLPERAALLGILALFVWLALPGLDRAFDYDEMYSASQFIVGQSWWDSATRVQTFNNHFANSLLASAAVRVLGPDEWVIRLPAFLLAVAAIVVIWRFTRRLSGPTAALCAAALLAISPAFIFWGQSARGYTGLACLGWLSVDAFSRILRTADPRQARVHAATTAVLPLFHLFGFWFLAIEYLAFLGYSLAARRTSRPATSVEGLHLLHRSFLVVGAVTLLTLLPMVGALVDDRPISPAPVARAASTTTGATTTVETRAPGGVRWAGLAIEMVASQTSPVLVIAGALLLIGGLTLPRREATLGVAVLVLPLCILWVGGPRITVFPRYFSFWIPMLAMLLAAGIVAPLEWRRHLVSRTGRALALAIAVATVAGGLFLARTWLAADQPFSSTGYREWLARPAGWADSRVAVVGQDAFMFDYYLGRDAMRVVDPAQMDLLLRSGDRLLVAYHDLPRNRPADRRVRDLLLRRCTEERRAVIVMFQCQ
jgi:4-amino-4-deoxy-L-arabinose transferase-like glycosyltransferase